MEAGGFYPNYYVTLDGLSIDLYKSGGYKFSEYKLDEFGSVGILNEADGFLDLLVDSSTTQNTITIHNSVMEH